MDKTAQATCPKTVWSIQVSSRNQEGQWNGTPSHTFHRKQYLKLFVRSDSAIYQIHFCDDSHVELEEAKDHQHLPITNQLGSKKW